MFSYIVAGISCLVLFYNPINEYFSSSTEPKPLPWTPRPRINESLLALDAANETAPNCPPDAYSVHILSKAPLVIYLENFLSAAEQAHLLEISDPLFEPSTITNDGASTSQNTLIRDSEVALIPRTDVVRCIERRALAFQGWREDLWVERLRTQRYGPSQHYSHHFDWGSGARGWGRASSFMVWADASEDLKGGGTEFPQLRWPGEGGQWPQWLEAMAGSDDDDNTASKQGEKVGGSGHEPAKGVIFKPVKGNAVFWENFRPDGTGRGWEESWHAGLPVLQGTKIGLNIWSWGRLS